MTARSSLACVLAAAMVVGGCEREPHVVSVAELSQMHVRDSKMVEVIEPGGVRHKMSVNEVVEQCGTADCSNRRVDLGDTTHVKKGTVGGIFATTAVVSLIACTAACDSPYNYISGGTLAVGGAVIVVGFIYFIKVMADMAKHD